MAEICCGVLSENETSSPCDSSSREARRRRMEIRRVKFVARGPALEMENEQKRQKPEAYPPPPPPPPPVLSYSSEFQNANENCASDGKQKNDSDKSEAKEISISNEDPIPYATLNPTPSHVAVASELSEEFPKFGMASVCGRRRDMEDFIALHPSFCSQDDGHATKLHYFGVYDGHGCSHVAMKCGDRLHELVKEELDKREEPTEWKTAMERSFDRMDKEVIACKETGSVANCRCELQTPDCDAVGSTAAVAILTPDKIVVANCGDSRAVLCRNGKAIPLSSDHKPDRPDELDRIQSAGGRVIYWEGPRVLGVLAMSRAIGDNYLKPYVSCEPEITMTDRTAEDDCLIIASDGLWDVVSNDTACGVVRMCLRAKALAMASAPVTEAAGVVSDKACSDASMLLTKLALARHSTDNVSVVVVDLKRATYS